MGGYPLWQPGPLVQGAWDLDGLGWGGRVSWVRGQSRPPPSPLPENILCVNTTGHLVKIIDFGLASAGLYVVTLFTLSRLMKFRTRQETLQLQKHSAEWKVFAVLTM